MKICGRRGKGRVCRIYFLFSSLSVFSVWTSVKLELRQRGALFPLNSVPLNQSNISSHGVSWRASASVNVYLNQGISSSSIRTFDRVLFRLELYKRVRCTIQVIRYWKANIIRKHTILLKPFIFIDTERRVFFFMLLFGFFFLFSTLFFYRIKLDFVDKKNCNAKSGKIIRNIHTSLSSSRVGVFFPQIQKQL